MMKNILILLLLLLISFPAAAQDFEKDQFDTDGGILEITFIGHGTLMMKYDNKVIHIDPTSRYADYSQMPKADLILVTHEHGDHLDSKAIEAIRKDDCEIILTETCADKLGMGDVMANGDSKEIFEIGIEAVPAYNPDKAFHPKGRGNGYVLQFGDKRVYVAGDTENIPEMKQLKDIDIAFLPMNLPYTMTPKQVADAARIIRPKILYPYHFGRTDTGKLKELLKNEKGIEVRIRKLS